MRRGKEIAQGSHASMGFLFKEHDEDITVEWLNGGQTKICVVVNSEKELFEVYDKANDIGLHTTIIQDSGRTEFGRVPTYTAVAIGPNDGSEIDKITGKLKLY